MHKHLKKITNLRKHFHETISLVLVLMLTLGSVFNQSPSASAATYYFSQSSWAGGASTETANHNSNRSGLGNDWTKYATTTTQAPSGLVGLWHMNGDFNDSSGNNNNGTAQGGAAANGSAKLGSYSGSFNGNGNYMTANATGLPTGSSARTIEGWVKVNSIVNSAAVFSYGTATTNSVFGLFMSSGNWHIQFWGEGQDLNTSVSVSTGVWQHHAVVYNGSTVYYYLNGELMYSGSKSGVSTGSGGNIVIGAELDLSPFFNGLVDEVAVYSRALSQSEVVGRFNSGNIGEEIGVSNITAGSTLALTSTSYTAADDGTFSTTGSATPMPNSGTGADGALDLASGCSGTGMTWSSPTCTINTDTKSVFNFTTINIPSGTTLTATGANYLTLHATGAVTVSGNISLSGGDGVAGRYGGTVGTSGAGATTTIVTTVHGADSYTSGGSVGQVGGSGSNCSDCNGGGGGGAGGSLIIKSNSITINSGGYIKSNGGTGGQGNVINFSGGGSGGSGGRLILISNNIINNGSIEAKGGAGGPGAGGSGVSSSSGGGFGGAGGVSGGAYSNTGGGGGGGGRITINTVSFSGTTPSITGGNGGSGSISGGGSSGSNGVYSTAIVGFIAGLFSNAAISGSGAGGASVGLIKTRTEGTKTDYAVGLDIFVNGVAFDNITNSVWVAGANPTSIRKFNINTGARTDYSLTAGTYPQSDFVTATFDNITNSVWVGSYYWNGSSCVSNTLNKVNVNTGGLTSYSSDQACPTGVAFDNVTNSVWVANSGSNTVSKVNINTGSKTDYAVGTTPYGVAFDNVTNSVWVANSGSNTVSKVNINTGSKTDYAVGTGPRGVAFDNVTNSVWVANSGSNTVSKVNINTGSKTDYAVGTTPYGVAFDNVTNSVWVANSGSNTVSKVNINTGSKTDYAVGTNPYGVAFDNVTNSVWVTNMGSKTVSKVALDTYSPSSGTFESATIDLGAKANLGNLDWTATTTPSSISAWSQISDTDFNLGTNSSTAVSGRSVGLGINTGAGVEISTNDSGLIGLWHMNNNWVDSKATKDGVAYNGATFGTAKLGNYSGSFDGVDDYVLVNPANTDLSTVSNITFELWVKRKSDAAGGIFTQGNQLGDGTPGVYFRSESGNFTLYSRGYLISTPLTLDTWHHIVATNDGSVWKLYKDGVLVGSYSSAYYGVDWNGRIYFGNGFNGYFNGDIDEFAIYNRALTASEIQNHYSPYSASGTYTSPIKQVGPNGGFGTMSWSATTASGQSVTMKVRSCNDSACSGETSFSSLSNATSGQDISSLTGVSDSDGYVQYQATFTTTDIMITPTLDSVTINITPLALQVATSDSSSGPWTYYGPNGATDTYFTSTGAAIPSALSGFRYFRYKAYIATADTTYTPTLNSVTLNYTQYSASGALISSKYDAIGDDSLITALSWSASNTSATETIKFQIRSASSSEGLDSAIWCGYSESSTSTCSGNNYFTSSDNGSALSSTHPLRNGVNDRWLQYKVILESAQGATPTLSSVSIQYVVNAPPAFDSSFGTNGISVNQIATSTDANWGKILAEHRIKDEDTVTGYASTTFAYRLNNADSWTSISTSYINPNVERRDISPAFSSTSTIWNAKSQIGEAYSTTTQIKIIINDLDAANNIGSSTSAAFILDTKNPIINSFNIDASNATTSFAFSDDSNIQYRVSNNADFSTDGNNKNEWQEVGATSVTFSGSWNFVNLPENSRIYYEVRDVYGNYAVSTSDAVPGIGVQNNSALNIKDLSSAGANEWREFISWYPYSATTSATFGSYQVYRSTDGNNYSLYRTITDSTENFLLDTSVSSSTTYYYKVRFVDSDGDISGFSAVASDLIDGQGGSDFVAPVISNASSTEVQSTWAKITWTTDELSDSKVEYGTGGSYNSSSTDQTWIDANATHTIILTGLNPSTTYNFRIKSKDILNNEGVATGYSFTTLGGAAISGVSCSDTTDNSITVVWNTDADASSYVDYSTSATFSSYNSTSPTSLIGEAGSIFQQKVEITGLSSGTKYYIKAKSSANNVTSIYPESGVFFCNTTSDSKPPRITQVQEALVSDANAVITWRTDEPATSQVEYGTVASTTTGNYATSTSKDSTLTLSHFVTLSGLSPETNYYYRAKSWDNNGTENSQTAVSDENDFKTNVAGQTTVVIYRGGGGSFTPVQEQPKDTTSPYAMNIEVVDIGAFSANVNFDTDEAAKTIVEYGYAAGEYDKNEASFASGFQTKHAIKLSNLKMGTDYHFRIQTVDKSGNIGYSIDQTFTTKYFAEVAKDLISFERTYEIQKEIEESIESILPSILPPFVENPRVTDITENSATIKWRTNIPAYSIVSYASERDYDKTKLNPYFAEASDMSAKKTNHEINLIGLISNSTYNIKVKSFSLPKAVGESKNIEFTTLASKVKARIADIKKDALRVVWTTDTPATSIVEYKNTRTGEINRKIKDARETDHDIVIENLAPDTSYEVRAMGYNEKGNLVEAGEAIVVRTSKDVKSPTISNIKIDNALVPGRTDKIQTVVSWKTDEMATSIVEYEEGSAKVGEELTNKEGSADTYAENHTVIVTKLRPGALYKIRVVSTDEANNKSVSPTRTIITPRQTESIVDVIVKNFEETFQFLKKIQ